jgi:hypothetical protein
MRPAPAPQRLGLGLMRAAALGAAVAPHLGAAIGARHTYPCTPPGHEGIADGARRGAPAARRTSGVGRRLLKGGVSRLPSYQRGGVARRSRRAHNPQTDSSNLSPAIISLWTFPPRNGPAGAVQFPRANGRHGQGTGVFANETRLLTQWRLRWPADSLMASLPTSLPSPALPITP